MAYICQRWANKRKHQNCYWANCVALTKFDNFIFSDVIYQIRLVFYSNWSAGNSVSFGMIIPTLISDSD